MSQRLTLALLLSALPVTALSATASAQPDAPPEGAGTDARARELYLRGDRLYAEGRYEDSISLFQEAYELSERPELLFNLANAYERAGRTEEAIAALRSYAPHAPEYDHDTIARRIRALEARLQEEPANAGPNATPPVRYSDEAPDARSDGASDTSDDAGGGGDGGGALVATGIVVLGLGVAAGAVGLGFGIAKLGASDDAAMFCMDGLCTDAAQDALGREEDFALAADVSFGIGGALALTGLILVIVGATSGDDEQTVSVRPVLGPTLGGIDVSTRF